MGRLLDLAAAALCAYAGWYILSTSGSWIAIVGHALAFYFFGKALYILRSLDVATASRDILKSLPKAPEAPVDLRSAVRPRS